MIKDVNIIKDIFLLIEKIPLLLQFVIPGFFFLKIFGFITSKKYANKTLILFSCAFSYLFIAFWSIIRDISIFSFIPNDDIANSGAAIFLGIIVGILAGFIFTRKVFAKALIFLTRRTPSDSIWLDLLDVKNGDSMKIYFKDQDYYVIGVTAFVNFDGDDPWWAVCKYAKIDKRTNSPYNHEKTFLEDKNKLYTFRLADVEHLEVFKNITVLDNE